MIFFEVALWVVLGPALAATAYLAVLAVLGLLPAGAAPSVGSPPATSFVVLIPAHNEASRLPAALASIRALDYAASLVRALVVADNCSDATADVARDAGVDVDERRDAARLGKGYALAHGLAAITGPYDAVLFLDADCTLSANALRSFDARIRSGDEAVQAYYTMDTGASATGPLRQVALTLVHRLRPRAKERLGASAGIKGSGMCFSRRTVERIGWSARGLAEDIEQHNTLLRAGARVAFADDVVVTGHAPSTLATSTGQHRRWEAGRASAARRQAIPLLARGLRARSTPMIDAAIEMLVPPISLLAAAFAVCAVAGWVAGAAGVFVGAIIGIALLTFYVISGVALARISARDAVRAAIAAPGYIVWKVVLYVRALFARPEHWEPTRRD